jgi:hypothetical protein
MRPDGTDQHLIFNGWVKLRSGAVASLAHKASFSPDGQKILFGCWSFPNQSNDICVMDADDTNAVDIVSTPDLDENFPSRGVAP